MHSKKPVLFTIKELIWIGILFFGIIYRSNAQEFDCKNAGLAMLRKYYPQAISVYFQLTDKQKNYNFIKCNKGVVDLTSLQKFVHENTHMYRKVLSDLNHKESFYLIDGSIHSIEYEPKFCLKQYFRNQLMSALSTEERASGYAKTYLINTRMGEQRFSVLLDELDAYAHGLNSMVYLPKLADNTYTGLIDGLSAMMVFTLRYYQHFHSKDPTFYNAFLLSDQMKGLVAILLAQAKATLLAVTDREDLSVDSKTWLDLINSQDLQSEWNTIDASGTATRIQMNLKELPKFTMYHLTLSEGIEQYRYTWKEFNFVDVYDSNKKTYKSTINGKPYTYLEYLMFLDQNPELKNMINNRHTVKEENGSTEVTIIEL